MLSCGYSKLSPIKSGADLDLGGQNELRLSGLVQNKFQKGPKMVVHLTKLSIYH